MNEVGEEGDNNVDDGTFTSSASLTREEELDSLFMRGDDGEDFDSKELYETGRGRILSDCHAAEAYPRDKPGSKESSDRQ